MKIITLAILMFIAPVAYATTVIDIEFKDSGERQIYHTTTLSRDLVLWYGQTFASIDMKVLLIETTTPSDKKYEKQNENLNALKHGEAEELQVMFVTACAQAINRHSYHTSLETAKNLSAGKPGFRVRLLNSTGIVLKSSSSPISTTELRRWLKQKQ